MNPTNLAETLAIQFGYTHWTVNAALGDMSEAEHLQAPVAYGNSQNWILGHLVSSRNGILKMTGRDPVVSDAVAERYGRGSAPVQGDAAAGLDELRDAFNASQAVIIETLPTLTAENLAAPAPFSPGKNPDETVGSLLAGLAFHEAYHAGQLGLLRRQTGRDGIVK